MKRGIQVTSSLESRGALGSCRKDALSAPRRGGIFDSLCVKKEAAVAVHPGVAVGGAELEKESQV